MAMCFAIIIALSNDTNCTSPQALLTRSKPGGGRRSAIPEPSRGNRPPCRERFRAKNPPPDLPMPLTGNQLP